MFRNLNFNTLINWQKKFRNHDKETQRMENSEVTYSGRVSSSCSTSDNLLKKGNTGKKTEQLNNTTKPA